MPFISENKVWYQTDCIQDFFSFAFEVEIEVYRGPFTNYKTHRWGGGTIFCQPASHSNEGDGSDAHRNPKRNVPNSRQATASLEVLSAINTVRSLLIHLLDTYIYWAPTMYQSRCQYLDSTSEALKLKHQPKKSQLGFDVRFDAKWHSEMTRSPPRAGNGKMRSPWFAALTHVWCSLPLHLPQPDSLSYTSMHFKDRLVEPQLLEAFRDPTGAASPVADLWQLCLPLS